MFYFFYFKTRLNISKFFYIQSYHTCLKLLRVLGGIFAEELIKRKNI